VAGEGAALDVAAGVVVGAVSGEDGPQMSLAEDQDAVGAERKRHVSAIIMQSGLLTWPQTT
jgi:hypothetical protein